MRLSFWRDSRVGAERAVVGFGFDLLQNFLACTVAVALHFLPLTFFCHSCSMATGSGRGDGASREELMATTRIGTTATLVRGQTIDDVCFVTMKRKREFLSRLLRA